VIVFVDTSAFYALADASDRNHEQAKAAYGELTHARLLATDHILIECWFLIGSRLGRRAALRFWDGLRSGIVTMTEVTLHDLDRAREILERYSDQAFSLVDATSFAVMERVEVDSAFTFDSHFQVYRFGKNNERRFRTIPDRP
jgi:predicted nucleic acid-binding protein